MVLTISNKQNLMIVPYIKMKTIGLYSNKIIIGYCQTTWKILKTILVTICLLHQRGEFFLKYSMETLVQVKTL